jgi:hypothetical protein
MMSSLLTFSTGCEVLQAIGYWGQASSFACCTEIGRVAPDPVECLVPLHALGEDDPAEQLFVSFVPEFRNGQLCWEEVMPILDSNKTNPLKIEIYVWPMVILERRGGNTILLRRSQTFFKQQNSDAVGGKS